MTTRGMAKNFYSMTEHAAPFRPLPARAPDHADIQLIFDSGAVPLLVQIDDGLIELLHFLCRYFTH